MNELEILRSKIDSIDEVLLSNLADRMEVSKAIGRYKQKHNLLALDKSRWSEVLKSRGLIGKEFGLPMSLVVDIFETIHKYSLLSQKNNP